jgi:hypothetical protein
VLSLAVRFGAAAVVGAWVALGALPGLLGFEWVAVTAGTA